MHLSNASLIGRRRRRNKMLLLKVINGVRAGRNQFLKQGSRTEVTGQWRAALTGPWPGFKRCQVIEPAAHLWPTWQGPWTLHLIPFVRCWWLSFPHSLPSHGVSSSPLPAHTHTHTPVHLLALDRLTPHCPPAPMWRSGSQEVSSVTFNP